MGGAVFADNPNIKGIIFQDGIVQIPYYTCGNCPSLSYVYISSTVTYLGGHSFHSSILTRLYIPTAVTTIAYAFCTACTKLKAVILPPNLKSMEDFAFSENHDIRYIAIPKAVESAYLPCCSIFTRDYALSDTGGCVSYPDSIRSDSNPIGNMRLNNNIRCSSVLGRPAIMGSWKSGKLVYGDDSAIVYNTASLAETDNIQERLGITIIAIIIVIIIIVIEFVNLIIIIITRNWLLIYTSD
jgi:hypothetical protein